MGNNRNKLLFLLGFIAFALISCWATSESLHLLLPNLPYVFCWVISVGFFVLASVGTKLIVDSLNTRIYVNRRGLKLIIGIVMVIIFWLAFSFPTNTHTFFYRNAAPNVINTDISVTYGYLGQLAHGTAINDRIKAEQDKFNVDLNVKKANLLNEIQNPNNPGFGPASMKALTELNKLLGSEIKPLSGSCVTYPQRKAACEYMAARIEELRKVKLDEIAARLRNSNLEQIKAEARTDMKNIDVVRKAIATGQLDVNDADDLEQISKVASNGYTTVMKYHNLVSFQSKEDEKKYSNPQFVTEVDRLKSVKDVWADYFHGHYDGRGFLTWILVSLLVDIAAFAFFDLAFSNKNDD